MSRRIVVTGLSCLSPFGNEKELFWSSLMNKDLAISGLKKLDKRNFRENSLSAEIDENKLIQDKIWDSTALRVMNYSRIASRDCLIDADLNIAGKNEHSVFIGTTLSSMEAIEKAVDTAEDNTSSESAEKLRQFNPFKICEEVSRTIGFKGTSMILPTACASGNYAISTGYSYIKNGKTKVALVGGVDAFSRSCYSIFHRLGAMTYNKCEPFGAGREGMVVGEGVGFLILEDMDHALKRGARIYAEIKGYGLSCDAYHAITPHPEGLGASIAIKKALDEGKLRAEDISFISTHGTGTKLNDDQEYLALKKVFKNQLKSVPLHNLKGFIGHCMGAASSLEAILSCLAIYKGIVPPNLNQGEIDEAFEGSITLPTEPREVKVKNVLSNSFAFGGNICSVIFGKVEVTK